MAKKPTTAKVDNTKALTLIKRNHTKYSKMVESLTIKSKADHEAAYTALAKIKESESKALTLIEPQRKSARETLDIILAQKKALVGPFADYKKIISSKISDYELILEDKQAESQKKLMVEAEKLMVEAEKETEKEIEKKNKRLKVLQAKKKPLMVKDTDAIATLLLEIDDLQASIDEGHATVTSVINTSAEKIKKPQGAQSQDDYEIDVVDMQEFLRAILTDKVPIVLDEALVGIKLTPIKNYVKATGNTNIPGCSIKKRKNIGIQGKGSI